MIAAIRAFLPGPRRWAARRRLRALVRATRALYRSPNPYEPYRAVNAVQRGFPARLPALARIAVPAPLREAGARRVQQIVINAALAPMVQEAILQGSDPGTKAVVPLPKSLWAHWPGGVARIDRWASRVRFMRLLAGRFRVALRRFAQLCRWAVRGTSASKLPYVVSINTGVQSVLSAPTGGVLHWLRESSPLAAQAGHIWVCSRYASAAHSQETARWVLLAGEPFPRLTFPWAYAGFLLGAGWLVLLAPLLALAGAWQALVLLPDLIEEAYLRQVEPESLPSAVLFELGDQANQPLWASTLEARGALVALLYYASSYSLFAYGTPAIPADIRHPALAGNHWEQLWFQSPEARDAILPLLGRPAQATVAGGFDMVDRGAALPLLPDRALAVFDVEPNAQLSRLSYHGFICPHVTEDVILAFWRGLATLAEELDLILVHKPKRDTPLGREWRYRELLAGLERAGRIVRLAPETGATRLLRAVTASAILPFTSVGDLAVNLDARAVFFDPHGTIANARAHANGLDVAQGVSAMHEWLVGIYGRSATLSRARA